jgi:hypothetical protein
LRVEAGPEELVVDEIDETVAEVVADETDEVVIELIDFEVLDAEVVWLEDFVLEAELREGVLVEVDDFEVVTVDNVDAFEAENVVE